MSALSGHRSFQKRWKSLIAVAERCPTVRQIKAAHAVFVTHGLHRDTYAVSKLLTAFASLSNLDKQLRYASLVFDSIETRNSFVYDAIIRICSRSSQPYLGIRYFSLMLKDDGGFVAPSNLTFHFLLVTCVNASLFITGRQIHCWVIKNGVLVSDGHVQTGVMRLYAEGKVLQDVRKMFDEIPDPDVVKWDVLMNGYVRGGMGSEGLRVFREMLVCGTEPDEFCVTTALTACAQAGAFAQGKWIHEFVKQRKGFESDMFIGTALVDMYAKCGCIDMAVEVFENLSKRNRFSWAAMIGGFAVHGHAKKAILCLDRMEQDDGIKPDGIVLLGVLAACAHGGLIEEGRSLLNNMEARYGITPKHEHHSCIVDLMCRAGWLYEALDLIEKMPMKPQASVWGALLNGCRTHKNVELAEIAVKNLLYLENGNANEEEAALVQLSNLYLSVQRSNEASKIRRMIGKRGIRKATGCSVVEVDGSVNEFVSGDASHPNLPRIHEMLRLLSSVSLQKL